MRTIMVINAKGGCGKTTISTNIASYYAHEGHKVALLDYDHQGSSMDWLAARPAGRPPIVGIWAWQGQMALPRNVDVTVMDVPANVFGKSLTELVRKAQTAIIPVLPSPIDMRAVTHFAQELSQIGKVGKKEIKLCLVANRVRENTIIAQELEDFLKAMKIPFIAHLRESQNYIRASENGLGVFELAPYLMAQEYEYWKPLIKWLNSKQSIP